MPKTKKDFSHEERLAIIKRAEEVGFQRAAEESDTLIKTIKAWKRFEDGVYPKQFTQEERTVILAKAKEIGFDQVAREYGINPGSIKNWKYKMTKLPNNPLPIVEPVQKANVDSVKAVSPLVSFISREEIEKIIAENALMKDKIVFLTTHIEKLRTVIADLSKI